MADSKRKQKPAFEFVSPYTLEQCVQRLSELEVVPRPYHGASGLRPSVERMNDDTMFYWLKRTHLVGRWFNKRSEELDYVFRGVLSAQGNHTLVTGEFFSVYRMSRFGMIFSGCIWIFLFSFFAGIAYILRPPPIDVLFLMCIYTNFLLLWSIISPMYDRRRLMRSIRSKLGANPASSKQKAKSLIL